MSKRSSDAEKAAVEAVLRSKEMAPEAKREYLEMLGCAAIHFMRATSGDEYTRGWLDHALSDLDRPPLVEIGRTQ
jgi:hypothetical protein